MKIMYFNINYGRIDFQGILDFVRKNLDVNIFCFQEISGEIETELDNVLPNYNKNVISKEIDYWVKYNMGIYVSKNYENFKFEIFDDIETNSPPYVLLEMYDGNSKWNILNFHGTPFPGDKLDNEDRIKASENLISFMKNLEGNKIIGGDFNLLPETKSIQIFEGSGYRNLIQDYKIKTTRNEVVWNKYPDNPQLFADYIFVSTNVKVIKFEAVQTLISDHLPLILEI